MSPNIHQTFCNPIVIPDYPELPPYSGPGSRKREDIWHREGKKLLSEMAIVKECCNSDLDQSIRYAYNREYGCPCENDVRATADPSVCYFDGKWYLYPTSGAVYSSDDLVNWTAHHEPTWMPISAPMAPTVEFFRGKYYATANSTPICESDNPIGPWKMIGEWTLPDGREFTCGDPMIFSDDDKDLYLYFGLGAVIMGAKLDPDQPNRLLTTPKVLISFTKEYWWERMGASNEDWSLGYLEGAWMVKRGKKYYLTYSCSGTLYYNYAMGCYIGDSPLGDFKPQPKNPISRSREGFIKGGGHGSFVKGPKDTLWVFYTIPVCVDVNMERRIGMDAAGFDSEGNLFALTGCDVPQWKPGILDHPEKGNATELIPVTMFKPHKVSSYKDGNRPLHAIDEAIHTWWQPAPDDKLPELAVSLRSQYMVSAVRIMWKDIGLSFCNGILPGPYRYVVEAVEDNSTDKWVKVIDASENKTDLLVDYRTFDPIIASAVRIRILGAPIGITPGLLNFTVFGESMSKPNRQIQ